MKKVHIAYVLASKYDDEGYVLRYKQGVMPSNTLSCMKTLTEQAIVQGELGDNVDAVVTVYDETVQRIPLKRLIRMNRRKDAQVIVGLVGVQSNQFVRAMDLAQTLRDGGVTVLIGGFHVSGVLAMFDEPTPELQRLYDMGVTVVKGEVDAPGQLGSILHDAIDGCLQALYDIQPPPDITTAPVPRSTKKYRARFTGANQATLDTSRGCPFNCSFCTVINVQGRRMRHRGAEHVLASLEARYDEGVDFYFFTDDNFSRNPEWEPIFDGLSALANRGKSIKFMMQVDTQAHQIPGFVEKARKAGCELVFVGVESLNADNLAAMQKKQNKVDEYAHAVDVWHQNTILVHAGYIVGLPYDTAESVHQDVRALRDTVKVDMASFFMLTPLPGSADHYTMVREGVPLDADLNNYDSLHQTFRHKGFQGEDWSKAYQNAWHTLYDKEHMVNVLLWTDPRLYWKMFQSFVWYRYSILTGRHPFFTGFVRLKNRKERRPIFPRESRLRYAWRRTRELLHEAKVMVKLFFEFEELWMLTRKASNPRWSTLADLRTKLTDLKNQLSACDLGSMRDNALQEVRTALCGAADTLHRFCDTPKAATRRAKTRIRARLSEFEKYIRDMESPVPNWRKFIKADQMLAHLVESYENITLQYVAKRRRLNIYHRYFWRRLKRGRIFSLRMFAVPRLVILEGLLFVRFGLSLLNHR